MKPFKIFDAKQINFLCLYHKLYESDKKTLEKTINSAGTAYGITIGKSDYIKMETENIEEWLNVIQKKFNPREYNQVIVLLDDYLEYEGFYSHLKEHSLETIGYPMQVILTNSLHKNAMSVVSNVLLQINSKIGGSLFKIEIPEEMKKKNLMIVGIDISAFKGQNKLNVAMCATLNSNFTEYTNKKESIQIQENGSTNQLLSLNVSSFIHEAIQEFFKKNKILPGGVIIYRQGVSKEQRVYLTQEVHAIENLLSGKGDSTTSMIYSKNPIPYYYILVNKKTSLKFFEKEQNYGSSNYSNPDCGLLILKDLVESDVYEFYIQPQKVNQGTATPTNFQVIYGNLDMPSYIPKITYDLCYMYSNWRGPVRVPAPLKYAEKLAKTLPNLHENSKNKLYHL
jgi:aubergine-like protein